jgi:hypothetical protein
MSTTIYISFDEPKGSVDKVEVFLQEVVTKDSNWNGVEFKVVRADFTFIESDVDEYEQIKLITEINKILSGEV